MSSNSANKGPTVLGRGSATEEEQLRQTPAGVIPSDWEAIQLKDLAEFANGRPHEQDVSPGGRYKLITLDSIDINGNLKNEHKAIDEFDHSLERNDIVAVLSDIAHGNLLGLCDLIPADNAYVLNQRMGRLRISGANHPAFIRLQINRQQHHFRERGQGTSQKHIYRRDFDALWIPLPSEVEQRAIAEALSDVDGLLGALDALIAKKRDIKTAAMQQLLTGKTRLPWFSGMWSAKELGEIAQVTMGQSPSSKYYNREGDGLPLIQGNADTRDRQTIKRVYTTQVTKLGKRGDIIMSVRAPVGEIARAQFDVCLGRGVCAIRYHNEFLYHALVKSESKWAAVSTGTTFDAVNSDGVKRFLIELPEDIEEQIAVASVLSEMDAEIDALERRRNKTAEIKQGMMQQLLTGRIRLIEPALEEAGA